jgi:hypothetical protein
MTWFLFLIYEKIEVRSVTCVRMHGCARPHARCVAQHTEFFNGNWSKSAGEHTSQVRW